ncbi:MAG TPA: molecular chaperone TorD family protein, partial [Vicinamibacteria bacterium]|nr:molecular chaperone TorD family protein [Vicinamibacteria bacterium]
MTPKQAAPPEPPDRTALDVDAALARSVLFRALTLGFTRPTDESLASLTSREAHTALLGAAGLLDRGRRTADPVSPAVRALTEIPAGTTAERRAAFARLFGHAHAPVPPFETEYGSANAFGQPQRLADIAGCYAAFGLRPAARLDERVDHVACQCEFLDFLSRKEAFVMASVPAGASGEEAREQLELVRDAERAFLRDHL